VVYVEGSEASSTADRYGNSDVEIITRENRTVGQSLLALKLSESSAQSILGFTVAAPYRERESAIVRRGALRGEVDTVGGLQLDLEGSYTGSTMALSDQWMRRTCSSVVEVLVDKLDDAKSAIASLGSRSPRGRRTYVVGGLRNVAEGWRRCLEDNRALDLDVLGGGHDGRWVWW
jgi:hypothetical protein